MVDFFEILRDEFQALHNQIDQLQIDHSRLKPACVALEQELEKEKRINKQLEKQLLECKTVQLDMLNAEVERSNKSVPFGLRTSSPSHSFSRKTEATKAASVGHDFVTIVSVPRASDPNIAGPLANSSSQNSLEDSFQSGAGRGNLFSSFKRMFAPGPSINWNDKLNRTSTAVCYSASIPTREVEQWVTISFSHHDSPVCRDEARTALSSRSTPCDFNHPDRCWPRDAATKWFICGRSRRRAISTSSVPCTAATAPSMHSISITKG